MKLSDDLANMEITPPDYEKISEREVLFDAGNITQSKIFNVYCRFDNK